MSGEGAPKPPASWQAWAQAAVWIMAILSTFLVLPPSHALAAPGGVWKGLAQFVVAILDGLAMLAALRFGRPRDFRIWVTATVLSFGAGLLSFGLYKFLFDNWACEISGVWLVRGTAFTPAAAAFAAQSAASDPCKIFEAFASDPLAIWQTDGVFLHEYILVGLFVVAIASLAVTIIALVQAHKIAVQPTKGDTP